jgi:hypothetical protein
MRIIPKPKYRIRKHHPALHLIVPIARNKASAMTTNKLMNCGYRRQGGNSQRSTLLRAF